MSYSPICKMLFELKHKGQPHYIRKRQKNAKPTGLTVAQRQIAAPPEGGQPASPLYQFFDISQYQNDWKPTIRQIMDRPEYGTEYVELDNGFWYLLELDGSFTHMTDHEFQDFLKWKKEQEAGENGGGDDNDLDTSMEDWDGEGEDAPDPSLSMLNSEIEALDAEMKDFDSELKRSSWAMDPDEEVDHDDDEDEEDEPKLTIRRWKKTQTLIDEFGRLDVWRSWERKHFPETTGLLQKCHWWMVSDRWGLRQRRPGVPELTVTTPEGMCFWLHDPADNERWS